MALKVELRFRKSRVRVRLADVAVRLLLDHAQTVGVGDVEGAQDGRVHDAEDHQIGGDGHGEGEDGGEGEAGRVAQAAGGDAQVSPEIVHGSPLEREWRRSARCISASKQVAKGADDVG